ncbi:MAG: SanA protein [Lachnospiraceae bacterium]|nr:SanA protein [Lachnospiraceae bacterium]
MKKIRKKLIFGLIGIGIVGTVIVLCINQYVKSSMADRILSEEEADELEGVDCIVVLGAGVWEDNMPSHMLNDRLEQGIALYEGGVAPKLLMSGDHGQVDYDEVNVMKQFAIDAGVPSEDIFMDHAGFSTYESMYRAKEIFQADKIVIVTQEYHLYRALYVAEALGIEAYGVASDPRAYAGQFMREAREILARNKDFITAIGKPEPTYLGETIPVSGNGNVTNDKD